jgi:hypothetical protein
MSERDVIDGDSSDRFQRLTILVRRQRLAAEAAEQRGDERLARTARALLCAFERTRLIECRIRRRRALLKSGRQPVAPSGREG